jgi:hypothetical protein
VKTNGLAKHYDRLEPSERFRLDVLAMARGDSLESDRLTRSCPRFTYTMNDRAFTGRWLGAMDMTLRIYVELGELLERLKTIELVRLLMPYSEEALRGAARDVYLEGHRAGARHAWSEAEEGSVPEWPFEGLDEERRIGVLMEPAVSVLAEILQRLERDQAEQALTLWRGFGTFCQEHLELEAKKIVRVVLEPGVGRIEELEELAERLELRADSERVAEIAEGLEEAWSIVERAG